MRKSFFLMVILSFVFSIAIFSCNDYENENKNNENSKIEPVKKMSYWEYEESVNKIDETKSYYARIYSINKEGFHDESYGFRLIIRNLKNEEDVLLISPPSPMSFYFGKSGKCRVRFDEAPPQDWSYSEGIDNDLIFFKNPQEFISKIKTTKKLMIGCESNKNVERIIEFGSVENLEWEDGKPKSIPIKEGIEDPQKSSSLGISSKSETPEEVAKKYIKALFNGDYGTMKKFATENYKKELNDEEMKINKSSKDEKALLNFFLEATKNMTPKIKSIQVNENGDKVRIQIIALDQNGKKGDLPIYKVLLVKENDTWKVNE